MAVTIIADDGSFRAASAHAERDDLWLTPADVFAATGWDLKPHGLCRGDRCVPLPPARAGEFLDAAGRVNVAAFARYIGAPVVHDDDASAWAIGEAATERRAALQTLTAPDFSLPDLDGKLHALSDYRGKKVLILSWASW